MQLGWPPDLCHFQPDCRQHVRDRRAARDLDDFESVFADHAQEGQMEKVARVVEPGLDQDDGNPGADPVPLADRPLLLASRVQSGPMMTPPATGVPKFLRR